MNEAHVFQHNYSGVQIFVYHCIDIEDAKQQFKSLVINYWDWQYLGKKIAKEV